ncbi:MAG: tetraacyldisaccharide 4'-kinase [Methylococcaceae bacterium]|nr:tetraacyldisaccharide 4'-kinase [Methylococcaceae bacterium]
MKPADWLQQRWYEQRPPLSLVALSGLFRAAVVLRRLAYHRGWKPAERLPVPVIVVGNLTVGGTGKTPLTIWLAQFLAAQGFKPGVISRGYGGRKQKKPRPVFSDSDPREVGDEPVLIARRTACPVYVFPRRAEAGRALLAACACDILVADDGLQHYALARDVEIAVVDGERRHGNGYCLPAGPLREPMERLAEADLIVCQGRAQVNEFELSLNGDEAVNLADERIRKPLTECRGMKLSAIAGIGNPGRFFARLRQAGLDFEEHPFPDHHDYTPQELSFGDEGALLMTEKDAVKCRAFAGPHHWYVPVRAELPPGFGEKILQRLKAIRDGQKTA